MNTQISPPSHSSSPPYWFRRKRYGWGWVPATWQGWLVLAVYLMAIAGLSSTLKPTASTHEVFFDFFLPLTICTSVLIFICYKTGEKPAWQWGESKEKQED